MTTTAITSQTWINPFTGREELDGYRVTWTEDGAERTTTMARLDDAEDVAAGLDLGLTFAEAGRYSRHGENAATDAQKSLIVKLERQGGIPQDIEGSVTIPTLSQMTKTEATWYIDQLKRR